MRDIALTAFVACLLPFALRYPAIGAYMWAWLGIMNPHRLTYGFAYSLPFAYIVALTTLIGFVFTRQRKAFPVNAITLLLLALVGWMTVSSIFSINPSPIVWDRWIFVMKIHLMLFVTLMLLRGRKQIDTLAWVIVLSVGFFGVKGGIWTLLTGGGGRVWGPPGGMLEDNNSLAIGILMVMPLMLYLAYTTRRRWLKFALLGGMVMMAFSVLGSQSRGALVGLLAMAFVLGIKGKYPWRTSIALVVLVAGAISFMPDTWTSRMDTIVEYGGDSSAMSRLHTWHTLLNVALDRPLVGAGFGADNAAIFERYGPAEMVNYSYEGRVLVAHSIYFQALGEHGFVGLFLYLALELPPGSRPGGWRREPKATRNSATGCPY